MRVPHVLCAAAAVLLAACGGGGGGGGGGTDPGSPVTPSAPWADSTGTDAYGPWADLTVSGNGLTAVQRFRYVAPGTFTMGSPTGETGRSGTEEEELHQVTLTQGYWIADSECTQRLYQAVTNANPSDHTTGGLDLPVDDVGFDAATAFLAALNALKPGLGARLPTEAQWERAARAGTSTPFAIAPLGADTINIQPNGSGYYILAGTYRNTTVPVKSLPANAWGLHEMHGNVQEWCSDWYVSRLGFAAVTDPTGPATAPDPTFPYRVRRGGCYFDYSNEARSASRNGFVGSWSVGCGLRLVIPAVPTGTG